MCLGGEGEGGGSEEGLRVTIEHSGTFVSTLDGQVNLYIEVSKNSGP